MEKFSKFRDPATGIYPFTRPTSAIKSTSENIIEFLKVVILGGILAILVKIPFLIVLTLLLSVVYVVAQLVFFPGAKRGIIRTLTPFLWRAILFLFGFYSVKEVIVNSKRGYFTICHNLRRKSELKAIRPLNDGDIIVSNHCSYIELLYLAYKYNPVFTIVDPFAETDACLRPVSLLSAILNIFNGTKVVKENQWYTLNELSEYAKKNKLGPVVIFPEGTTSNGRAVLKFVDGVAQILKFKGHVQIIGFKYFYESFCPTFTVGTMFHMVKLMCQIQNSMEVRFLESLEMGNVKDLEETLANMLKVQRSSLGYRDKLQFLEYYNNYKTGKVKIK